MPDVVNAPFRDGCGPSGALAAVEFVAAMS
jgi:hypothetical protein